ncbi:MAG: STAS domain-containing protein [Janthinobacterium lividum]
MTTTSTLTDGILYLTLSGEFIGGPGAEQLLTATDEHLENGIINCVVDIASIGHINSTGIEVLVSLLTKFRSHGGELILLNPADYPIKMLAFTKLNNIFTVVTDAVAARQQLVLAAS